jgi:hypothetical protein
MIVILLHSLFSDVRLLDETETSTEENEHVKLR